jgi:RNA polymerase-binding transcription factor
MPFIWKNKCQVEVMTQTSSIHESNKFQVVLEALIGELERVVRHRDEIAVEQTADQVDEVQRASELALAISNLDRQSHRLRNARAALRRIEEGSFGICEQCDEEIHPKRLAAIPWAALCIHCQEALDNNREDTNRAATNFIRDAA